MHQHEANTNVFKMCLGQQDSHSADSPARNSTPTSQLQRKCGGLWCFSSRQRGTTRSRRLAYRSCHDATLEVGWQKSIRYCAAWPCMQLYITTLILQYARCSENEAHSWIIN